MGEHVNTKKDTKKHHKAGFSESRDVRVERASRVSFKNYMQNLEDELLEQELTETDWVVERGCRDGDEISWIEIDTFATEEEAEAERVRLEKSERYDGDVFRIREV